MTWKVLVALVWLVAAVGCRSDTTTGSPAAKTTNAVYVVTRTGYGLRTDYGLRKLRTALEPAGFTLTILTNAAPPAGAAVLELRLDTALGNEGFALESSAAGRLQLTGGDETGLLYGCLALGELIGERGALPVATNFSDRPRLRLRGVCVGMQKMHILPGRKVYEYPYTPELFPWFYDKALWTEFLDFLAERRFNTLYLWNGHPFASLVRVPEYPFAVEVPEDVFRLNREIYRWLAEECDRRGIWLVQMFYSLLVSKPFAERYGISTQLPDLSVPEALDYTRKSIAAFVAEYPNVGLLVCLGEALQGVENQKKFLLETIIPGVLDGMRAAGLTQQPPLIVRAHATDPEVVMPVAAAVYSNLYTMAKYNGEALTTWEPRGLWQRRHMAMSRLASNHIVNVHILANLEPFRYGAQRFIKKCVLAMRDRLGATGLHLYPLAYWNWPCSPDAVEPPLKQWERDWMWFSAWARYAWNPDIDEHKDEDFWVRTLASRFGSEPAAAAILQALNDAGECAPRLLRRFGITDGNRQTLSLGMTLEQLTDPEKFNPYSELWLSHAPPGERLAEFVERELAGTQHEGETPLTVIAEVLTFSSNAVVAVDWAAPLVRRNSAEFERIRTDVKCIRQLSLFYAEKVWAAIHVLRYRHTRDRAELDRAAEHLRTSLDHFRTLVTLTTNTYLFANSLQTSHRKIPYVGAIDGVATNYHWAHVLPLYEKEYREFTNKLARLRTQVMSEPAAAQRQPWPPAKFALLSTNAETYTVELGAQPFRDRGYRIIRLAPELRGLTGIRFSHEEAKNGRYSPIEFEVAEPVWVLIGYFQENRSIWLQPPNPDFAAHLTDKSGLEPVLVKAVRVESCPEVNVHAMAFGPGRHRLTVHGPGSFIIVGVIPQTVQFARSQTDDDLF